MSSVTHHSVKFLNPSFVLAQSGIGEGMQVADFGCGQGDFALAAAKLVGPEGKVCAIDIQDSALSSTRSKARIGGLLNIVLVKGNVEVSGSERLRRRVSRCGPSDQSFISNGETRRGFT